MFTVQCADVWNKVCYNLRYPTSITYLCHKYLIIIFNICYIYNISVYICIGPKNLILVRT